MIVREPNAEPRLLMILAMAGLGDASRGAGTPHSSAGLIPGGRAWQRNVSSRFVLLPWPGGSWEHPAGGCIAAVRIAALRHSVDDVGRVRQAGPIRLRPRRRRLPWNGKSPVRDDVCRGCWCGAPAWPVVPAVDPGGRQAGLGRGRGHGTGSAPRWSPSHSRSGLLMCWRSSPSCAPGGPASDAGEPKFTATPVEMFITFGVAHLKQ